MKRFEFKCPECGNLAESDDPDALMLCNHPGKGEDYEDKYDLDQVKMKRVWSIAGTHFKGKGFYKTDNQ